MRAIPLANAYTRKASFAISFQDMKHIPVLMLGPKLARATAACGRRVGGSGLPQAARSLSLQAALVEPYSYRGM